MTIYNLGSINADYFYALPHLPGPGETLAATALTTGLGGKGANQSVAAALAGARVVHIGAVGRDGQWAVDRMTALGVETRHIATVDTPTGHAIVMVDPEGENQIVIFPGANHAQSKPALRSALSKAQPGDILLLQNETNLQSVAADLARQKRMRVIYAAAPFDAAAVVAMLGRTDILLLNKVEARQLVETQGRDLTALEVTDILVTLGADGCRHYDNTCGAETHYPGIKVDVVDSTGAGDTFTGYLCAGLDSGMSMPQAILRAQRAAALMVTRMGTADVIPDLEDLERHFNTDAGTSC